MNIITTREMILAVADRWENTYGPGHPYHTRERMDQLRRLRELDAMTATPEDVGEIISRSWIDLKCDECGKVVDAVIQVGEPPDWESATARLCAACVEKAAFLMLTKPEVTP
jgi:hypothetical protein